MLTCNGFSTQKSETRTGVSWGFTLVETVIAASVALFVLAVLASSVRAARTRDRTADCLANMRTIGQASLVYAAEDPNELLIPVPNLDVLPTASGTFEWGGKAGAGQSTQPPDVTYSVFGTRSFRGPAHRPLNHYLYKGEIVDYNPIGGEPNPGPGGINYLNDTQLDLDVYRCPSDTGYAGGGFLYTAGSRPSRNERAFRDEGLTAYDHYGTSYIANTFWITGGIYGNRMRSASVYFAPLSRVPSPSHALAYQEIPSRFTFMWGSWEGSGCEWVDYENRVEGGFNIVPGWHGQDFHFNVTFADGHSAMVEMQGCIRPAPNLGPMNYPPHGCGSTPDPYECRRCVTIRGPEWSMDTLPAPAAMTPWISGDRSSSRSDQIRVIP